MKTLLMPVVFIGLFAFFWTAKACDPHYDNEYEDSKENEANNIKFNRAIRDPKASVTNIEVTFENKANFAVQVQCDSKGKKSKTHSLNNWHNLNPNGNPIVYKFSSTKSSLNCLISHDDRLIYFDAYNSNESKTGFRNYVITNIGVTYNGQLIKIWI